MTVQQAERLAAILNEVNALPDAFDGDVTEALREADGFALVCPPSGEGPSVYYHPVQGWKVWQP